MKIDEFATIIRKLVEEELDEGYEVHETTAIKNNGVKYTGLLIRAEGDTISPTIYLEKFLADYEAGKIKLIDAAREIIKVYESSKIEKPFKVSGITNFEECKGKIFYKLINAEMNKELLKTAPHKIVCEDLAIVFYIKVSIDKNGMSSALVNNDLMKIWGISDEELYEIAVVNTPNLFKERILDLQEMLASMMMHTEAQDVKSFDKNSMYVCTNVNKCNGAGVIFYKDFLKNISEKVGTDLYIIPSSIHEVIIVPVNDKIDSEMLKSMVPEVNETEVTVTEVLSNHLYLYKKTESTIIFA